MRNMMLRNQEQYASDFETAPQLLPPAHGNSFTPDLYSSQYPACSRKICMKLHTAVLLTAALLGGCDVSFNKPAPKVIASDPGTPQQQQQVFDTAISFLGLLDAGEPAKTWSAASSVMQAKTSELAWVAGLKTLRVGLGSFQTRQPETVGFIVDLPDAPAGRYAVIEFASTFATTTVKEKVIFRDDDTRWGVVGYFVHKSVSFGGDGAKAP